MAWKKDSTASFSGGSGQMAVIAELLHRKCNAAIPYIDVGTDVFAFRDEREEVARIQVKTDTGKRYKSGGYSAKFGIPMNQLKRADSPPLFYALAVRLDDGWAAFIIISRSTLKELWNAGLGSENKKSGNLELHIQFRMETVEAGADGEQRSKMKARCGTEKTGVFDLTEHLNAWGSLPPLQSIAALEPAAPAAGGEAAEAQVEEIDHAEPEA